MSVTTIERETKADAANAVEVISRKLIDNNVNFIIDNSVVHKRIRITSVKGADIAKYFFPAFQILVDSRQARYAEYIIYYE